SSRSHKSKNLVVNDIPIRSRSWQDVSIDAKNVEHQAMSTYRSHVTLGFDSESQPNVAAIVIPDIDSYRKKINLSSNSLDSLTSSNDSRLFLLDPSKKGKRPANKFSLFSKTMKRLVKSGGGDRDGKKRSQCYSTGVQAERNDGGPSRQNENGISSEDVEDVFDSDSSSFSSNDTETFNLNFEK
uniref:Uncharacterized protein n=1 Tax=Romanomermis culicivorax TaxID=13658 RepID=A0A915LDZ1_ROMCU